VIVKIGKNTLKNTYRTRPFSTLKNTSKANFVKKSYLYIVCFTDRKCFLALKVIFKDHLQPILPPLPTYYIKIVFLNTVEKHGEDFWNEENIETCLQTLLEELQNVFDTAFNIFSIKTKIPTVFKCAAKKIKEIRKNPAPYVCDDGTYRCCCRRVQQETVSLLTPGHQRSTCIDENCETCTEHLIQMV